MSNPQGTAWETELVSTSSLHGERLPKRGVKGEPDLWLGTHPSTADRMIPVVAWKRLVPVKGKQRRTPDGVRDVIVMSKADFDYLTTRVGGGVAWMVQAKWTERLNVTRVLHSLTTAVKSIYSDEE